MLLSKSRVLAALDQIIPDDETKKLPGYSYRTYPSAPYAVYTRNEQEANDIIQTMRGPFGFDMEWRCTFYNGVFASRRTALVQICDAKLILMVHLSGMKRFPQQVKKVIESPEAVKMGVNIRSDGVKLFQDYGVLASNLVELGGLAKQADPLFAAKYKRPKVALALMVEFYEQKELSKGPVQRSNWEKFPLTEEQREYAANDAHCALEMYKKLVTMAQTNGGTMDPGKFTSDLGKEYSAGTLTMRQQSLSEPTEIPRPQWTRAYDFWHNQQMALPDICAALRSKENPLKESTVISYVVQALKADKTLPFDMEKLKELVYQDIGSWPRHGQWIVETDTRPQSNLP